ncbi:MAG: DUF1566 domain-containing protein, partial [Gammaproteobacteria bacterium]|nr:DUF1566 domain-containing protein [Gammaproteobacteria bacterium]
CGYSDWRIPETDELITLVDDNIPIQIPNNNIPAIKTFYFPYTLDKWYWTASPWAAAITGWSISFHSGTAAGNHKGNHFFVRLVRSGRPSSSLPAMLFLLF